MGKRRHHKHQRPEFVGMPSTRRLRRENAVGLLLLCDNRSQAAVAGNMHMCQLPVEQISLSHSPCMSFSKMWKVSDLRAVALFIQTYRQMSNSADKQQPVNQCQHL